MWVCAYAVGRRSWSVGPASEGSVLPGRGRLCDTAGGEQVSCEVCIVPVLLRAKKSVSHAHLMVWWEPKAGRLVVIEATRQHNLLVCLFVCLVCCLLSPFTR